MSQRETRIAISLTLVLLIIPSAVKADIIPEGEKSVQYCFQVLSTERYPDYVFLVYFRGVNYSYDALTEATAQDILRGTAIVWMKDGESKVDIFYVGVDGKKSSLRYYAE